MPRITVRKAAIIGVLNMDLSRITSVRLAPALPMISAMTAPIPIPLPSSTDASGITGFGADVERDPDDGAEWNGQRVVGASMGGDPLGRNKTVNKRADEHPPAAGRAIPL